MAYQLPKRKIKREKLYLGFVDEGGNRIISYYFLTLIQKVKENQLYSLCLFSTPLFVTY